MESKNSASVVSDVKSVHQFNIMTLRFRRKGKIDLTGVKPLTSIHLTAAKQVEMLALEMVSNYPLYTVGLGKAVLPVSPIKIKVFMTFAKPINSECCKESLSAMELGLKSVRRVNEVAVL